MGFKELAIAFGVLTIFVFAFLNFGIQLASDNEASQSISDDPTISTYKDNLESNLGSLPAQTNASQKAFWDSIPILSQAIQIASVPAVVSGLISIPYTMYQLTVGLVFDKLFGGSEFGLIFGVLGSIIALLIILYSWKVIRTGDYK